MAARRRRARTRRRPARPGPPRTPRMPATGVSLCVYMLLCVYVIVVCDIPDASERCVIVCVYDCVCDTPTASESGRGRASRHQKATTNQLNRLRLDIVPKLRNHDSAWYFRDPVNDWEVKGYRKVITHPMDLKTIMEKLETYGYSCAQECIDDVELMFDNCFKFNTPIDSAYEDGQVLQSLFQQLLAGLPRPEVAEAIRSASAAASPAPGSGRRGTTGGGERQPKRGRHD
eukprot:m.30510 g.30510  ORF g.30510 m.30510 type:complete len:230 (+) comp4783_c0_seq2:1586-2275(+)